MELLHPAIGAVEASFVEASLIPRVSELLVGCAADGGLLFVVVDAIEEGDYVVGRIRSWGLAEGMECVEGVVAEEDPFVVWEDLVGDSEAHGALRAEGRRKLVLVRGGCVVPVELVARWARILAAMAKVGKAVVVWPVLRSAGRELREEDGVAVVSVPSFGEVGRGRRRALCEALLGQRLEGFQDAGRVAEELVGRNPSSRTEMELWVDEVVAGVQGREVLDFDAICGRRLMVRPSVRGGRERLRGMLGVAEEKIQDADAAFQEWQGRLLAYPVRSLGDPFSGPNTFWWFVGTISHISCRLDGVDGAFWYLARLNPDGAGDVVCEEEPRFFGTVRALRTLFQHGLVMSDRKNRETVEIATTWFRMNCGRDEPRREHWRKLTGAIVGEWYRVVERVAEVVRVVPTCSARGTVVDGLERASRRLSRHRWKEIASGVIEGIDATIDVERFVEQRQEKLAGELRGAAVSPEGVVEVAKGLVEKYVVEEACRCPVRAEDLVKRGVARGRELGSMLREADRFWREREDVGEDELWRHLMEKYPQLG